VEFFLGAFTAEWESRRAAFLHDLSLGRRPSPDEDERRRRGGAAATSEFIGTAPGAGPVGRPLRDIHRRADRPMRTRFAGLAGGSQPAVVKLASFGGGARLQAMITYVARNGAVDVETEQGDRLRGRDQLAAVGGSWDHLLNNRAESRDIGLFRVAVEADGRGGDDRFERARSIVRQALGDRAFAVAVTERADGSGFDIDGVTVLRSKTGERLSGDAKASAIVQQRLQASLAADGSATFRFTGFGNGTDYGSSRLRSLVKTHRGEVQDEQGRPIGNAREAGDLVQLEWRDQLHSRKPRDVMHLILSARAGTDRTAFEAAAREFLGAQFAGHRYVFAVHDAASDPKPPEAGGKRPHLHVHAIVALRSDGGDRIETSISTFRQWRLTMAEKARGQGIAMEMTDRRDRASPAAYSRNQVRPVTRLGRTEHAGTSAAAQRRYDAKRADRPSLPESGRSQAYGRAAQRQWLDIDGSQLSQPARAFVAAQASRLDDRAASADRQRSGETSRSGGPFQTQLRKLVELVSKEDDMRQMTRAEFDAYETRVEAALFQAERTIAPQERAGFDEIAAAARDHVNVRRELVALTEQRPRGASGDRDDGTAGQRDERQRWNDAVARYGRAAAEAGNAVLVEVERSRDALARAQAAAPEKTAALQQQLDRQLIKAAELGAAGNGLIRDVAAVDEALKTSLRAVERGRQQADGEPTTAQSERTGRSELADPQRGGPEGGQVPQLDAESRPVEDDEPRRRDVAFRRSAGDGTNSDPVDVPRLREWQRQADERKEHDGDDRER
jgi:hypothetical protein